jgi:FkbM family methyltransferase
MMKLVKVRLKDGKTIKFETTHNERKYIITEIYDNDCYFPRINGDIYGINQRDVVIDIGANVGMFSVYAAKLASRGVVYGFEPEIKNFSRLKKHKALNKVNNLNIENVGISNKRKRIKLYLEKINDGGHSAFKSKYENLKETVYSSEMVSVIPLKEVFDKHKIKRCHFLKIDCEGEESRLLRALPKSYFKRIDKIALEFHPNIDEVRLARFLREQGFRVTIHHLGDVLGMIFARRRD